MLLTPRFRRNGQPGNAHVVSGAIFAHADLHLCTYAQKRKMREVRVFICPYMILWIIRLANLVNLNNLMD